MEFGGFVHKFERIKEFWNRTVWTVLKYNSLEIKLKWEVKDKYQNKQ